MGEASESGINGRPERPRALLACACLLVFLMSMQFGSVGPLLPQVSEGRSHLFASFVVGGHPIGSLLGALPMVVVARRYGMHVSAIAGAVLLAAGVVVFAWFDGGWLVAGRFGIGFGGALCWQAVFAWSISATGAVRRGRTIGVLWSAIALGGIFGPQLGALAAGTTRWVLVVPAAVMVVVSLYLAAVPRYAFSEPASPRRVVAAFRSRAGAGAVGLQAVLAFGFMLVSTLAPLALSDRGLSAAELGAVFTAAALVAVVANPFSGRIVDRGRLRTLVVAALGAMVLAALALPLLRSAVPAVLAVLVLLTANSVGNVPTGVLMAGVVEREQLDQSLNLAIGSLLWATSALIGALAAGVFASEWPAMILLAALNGAALLAVVLWRASPRLPAGERGAA
jgi:MFS family permease